MSFKKFIPQRGSRLQPDGANLTAAGQLTIGELALRLIRSPKEVCLYFDAETDRIGIMPASPGERGALRLRRPGEASTARHVMVKGLLQAHGIRAARAQYTPKLEEGMLVIGPIVRDGPGPERVREIVRKAVS